MQQLVNIYAIFHRLLDKTRHLDFLGPLALRLYLAPIFWAAGTNKLSHFESTAQWFGNAEWGLGLPMPGVLAALAIAAEIGGAVALLAGVAVRWAAIPLMITMAVAAVTAHWTNGWHALPESELTVPWEWRTDLIEMAADRKAAAVSLLETHGHYGWLTEAGSFTILKNGIEFAATYFIMLLVLFFTGAGRYASIDYWLKRKWGSALEQS